MPAILPLRKMRQEDCKSSLGYTENLVFKTEQNTKTKLDKIALTCNSGIPEAKARGSGVKIILGFRGPCLRKKKKTHRTKQDKTKTS